MSIILNMTLHKMEQESVAAPKLMDCCAFLYHENIPDYSIDAYFYNENEVEKSDGAIRVAREYALITINDKNHAISLHFLLQESIRKKLASGVEKNISTHIKFKKELLSYLEEILKSYDIYANKVIEEIDLDQLLLLTFLSDPYRDLGDIHKEKEFFERTLSILEKHYGNDL